MPHVPVSFGRRLTQLAAQRPAAPAIVWIGQAGAARVTTWAELDRRSNQLAHAMAQRRVDNESLVVIGLPNVPEHFVAGYAAWKLGALVLPLKDNLPVRERDQILEVGAPTLVVADWDDIAVPTLGSAELAATCELPDEPLPDVVPQPGKQLRAAHPR